MPNSNHTIMARVKNAANLVLSGSQGAALMAGHLGWHVFGVMMALSPPEDENLLSDDDSGAL